MSDLTVKMPESSVQASTVQIPTELLSSILASVEELKSSVSNLEADNQRLGNELGSVKTDVVALHRSCGVKFRKFPQLPVELRRYTVPHPYFAVTDKLIHMQEHLDIRMHGSSIACPKR